MSMRHRLPGLADAAMAAAMMAVLYYLTLRVVIWEDFFVESAPAVRRLLVGICTAFSLSHPSTAGRCC